MKKERKHHATYWEYTGNHSEGKDCSRENKYGYTKELISFLQYSCYLHSLYPHTRVTYHFKGEFGRTVKVTAPKEVWEKAMLDFAEELGEQLLSDYPKAIVHIVGDIPLLYDPETDRQICELFYKTEGITDLDMVKKGYAVFVLDDLKYFFKSSSL